MASTEAHSIWTPEGDDLALTRIGYVAHLRWTRPPHNHVDADFMRRLADGLDALDGEQGCRVVVLSAGGKAFCAGADFGAVNAANADAIDIDPASFYVQALRLFRIRKPIVAAMHGAAIGAGLGLGLVADFRIAGPSTRLSANFVRLGFHPGFAMTVTLPRVVGEQAAATLLYTGRRVDGAAALRMGLVDELADSDDAVLTRALAWADELAVGAPVALQAARETLRQGLADAVAVANRRELEIQRGHFRTADFREGIAAAAQRREPRFLGR